MIRKIQLTIVLCMVCFLSVYANSDQSEERRGIVDNHVYALSGDTIVFKYQRSSLWNGSSIRWFRLRSKNGSWTNPADTMGVRPNVDGDTTTVRDTTYWKYPISNGLDSISHRCYIFIPGVDTIESSNAVGYVARDFDIDDSQIQNQYVVKRNGTVKWVTNTVATPSIADSGSYQWYFNGAAISAGTFPDYTPLTSNNNRSGTYYMIADNGFFKDTTKEISLDIVEGISIAEQYPVDAVFNTIEGGSAYFSFKMSADSISYRYDWYKRVNGVTTRLNVFNAELATSNIPLSEDNAQIFCKIIGSYKNVDFDVINDDINNPQRFWRYKIGNRYNPFDVTVERVSNSIINKVKVKLSTKMDLSNFPIIDCPKIFIPYQSNGFVTKDTTGVKYLTIPTVRLNKGEFTPWQEFTVENNGNVTQYNFSFTTGWNSGLVVPFKESNVVQMNDQNVPENPLFMTNVYLKDIVNLTDTVKVTVQNVNSLDNTHERIYFQCVRKQDTICDTSLTRSQLQSNNSFSFRPDPSLGAFPIPKEKVTLRWWTVGPNGEGQARQNLKRNDDGVIGWEPPVYTANLSAEPDPSAYHIAKLKWSNVPQGPRKIRILYSTDKSVLQGNPDITNSLITVADSSISVNTTETKVTNLLAQTEYYFAIQVEQDLFWSAVPDENIARMLTGSNQDITNETTIDNFRFDADSNQIIVAYSVNMAGLSNGEKYYVNSVASPSTEWNSSNPPRPEEASWSKIPAVTPDGKGTMRIDIANKEGNIDFNSDYTFGLWLKKRGQNGNDLGTPAPPVPNKSSRIVRVTGFKYQKIVRPSSTENELSLADNTIRLKKIGNGTEWPIFSSINNTGYGVINRDSLVVNVANSLNFDQCDATPIRFADNLGNALTISDSFYVGFKVNLIPADSNFVKIYYVQGNKIFVDHSSYYDSQSGMVWGRMNVGDSKLGVAMTAMVDRQKPTLSILSSDSIVSAGEITDQFSIIDNVANVKWVHRYGIPDVGYQKSDSSYVSGQNGNISRPINGQYVDGQMGVLVEIIVDDGTTRESVNASRMVRGEYAVSLSASQSWVPVGVNAVLEEVSLREILQNSITGWNGYDKTKLRIFKYNAKESDTGYVEFDGDYDDKFDLVPGNLIWCKGKQIETFKLGGGHTVSLRGSQRITLKPDQWVDFMNPYKFPVMLKDISDSTGNGTFQSLLLYEWKNNEFVKTETATYDTKPRHIGSIHGNRVTGVLSAGGGYTIKNSSGSIVTLVIPAIPQAVSSYNRMTLEAPQEVTDDFWYTTVEWKHEELPKFDNKIYLGTTGNTSDLIGGLSPTFSPVRVGIVRDNSSLLSYRLNRKSAANGVTETVRFVNKGKESSVIQFKLNNDALPEGVYSGVYSVETQSFGEADANGLYTVTIPPQSSVEKTIAIGDQEYMNETVHSLFRFNVLNAYPNPFVRNLRIVYNIPLNIKELNVNIYDLKGRIVWSMRKNRGFVPGKNLLSVNLGNRLSSGMYIMRLTAKDIHGKKLYGGNRKITCLK